MASGAVWVLSLGKVNAVCQDVLFLGRRGSVIGVYNFIGSCAVYVGSKSRPHAVDMAHLLAVACLDLFMWVGFHYRCRVAAYIHA